MHLREKVADLNFYLFEGVIHPELFDIREVRTFTRNEFRADVWLIGSGHVVVMSTARGGITEVVSPTREVLPWHRLLHTFCLGQRVEDRFSCLGAFAYHVSYSRERLPAKVFAAEHAVHLDETAPDRLVVRFPPTRPNALVPFAAIDVEATQRHVSVHAVHAFPNERTLVKMQSLIEMRGSQGAGGA
jgi:hypothetical protein